MYSVTIEDSSAIFESSSLNILSAFNFKIPGKSDFVSANEFWPSVVIFINVSSSFVKERTMFAAIKSGRNYWK